MNSAAYVVWGFYVLVAFLSFTPGGCEFMALDVEAVATGRGHNDRTPCRVSVVDETGRELLDRVIHVQNIFNPLTELHGLTCEEIESSNFSLSDAQAAVRNLFSPTSTVIIGQYPESDIQWMGLKEGEHFKSSIDIATLFRAWNPRFRNWRYFSLSQTVYGLLNERIQEEHHSSLVDAQKSMQLFLQFGRDLNSRSEASKKLFNMLINRRLPVSKRVENQVVCCYKFNPSRCFCGQPNA